MRRRICRLIPPFGSARRRRRAFSRARTRCWTAVGETKDLSDYYPRRAELAELGLTGDTGRRQKARAADVVGPRSNAGEPVGKASKTTLRIRHCRLVADRRRPVHHGRRQLAVGPERSFFEARAAVCRSTVIESIRRLFARELRASCGRSGPGQLATLGDEPPRAARSSAKGTSSSIAKSRSASGRARS